MHVLDKIARVSDQTSHQTISTRPAAPRGLPVSAFGTDFIEWSWNAVTEADGYEVLAAATRTYTLVSGGRPVAVNVVSSVTWIGSESSNVSSLLS